MQKLEECIVTTAIPISKLLENAKINTPNKYKIQDLPEWRDNLPIAIVGGGPSLKNTIGELKDYKYIMVAGSAHDYVQEWAIKNDKKITFAVICDGDPVMQTYLQNVTYPTKYLVASQCDPNLFKYLDRYDVYLWHSGGEGIDNISFGEGELVLGGGVTVGTRAIAIALGMGFSDLHLYGFDNCLTSDYKHHAYDFNDPEKETLGNIAEIQLEEGGKKYAVAGYMLAQLFDFKKMLAMYSSRMKITIHGEGLLKDFMDIAYKKAIEVQNG